MLSSLRRFLNEFNDRFTSETLDCTSGSNYATLFHQPVDRIHYILTLFSHRDVEWLSVLVSYVFLKVCMYVLVRLMWSCMFIYGYLYLSVCIYVYMYVCIWQSAEPEDNSRSEKLSELFEERSKWILLTRQVRLLLYIHTYIHTYHYTFNDNLGCSYSYIPAYINAYIHTYSSGRGFPGPVWVGVAAAVRSSSLCPRDKQGQAEEEGGGRILQPWSGRGTHITARHHGSYSYIHIRFSNHTHAYMHTYKLDAHIDT